MVLDSKHSEAKFLLNSTDMLHLHLTQDPISPHLAIFMPTMTLDYNNNRTDLTHALEVIIIAVV